MAFSDFACFFLEEPVLLDVIKIKMKKNKLAEQTVKEKVLCLLQQSFRAKKKKKDK